MAKSAFTLVETLLSITLLGFVMILVMNLFPTSMASVRKAEQRYHAGTLASSILEQQASLPFQQLAVGTSRDLYTDTAQSVQYRPHLEIQKVAGEDVRFLKSLRVTVKWTVRQQTHEIVRELWVHHLPSQP